jgi:uncharacterized Zn finger protein
MFKVAKVVLATQETPSSSNVKCPLCGSTKVKYIVAGYSRGVKCRECGILIPTKLPAI